MKYVIIVSILLLFMLSACAVNEPPSAGAYTYTSYYDVSYGSDPSQKLDAFLIDSEEPVPVVIFMHGGGFRAGDKENTFYKDEILAQGISYISVTYRKIDEVENLLDIIEGDFYDSYKFVMSRASQYNIDPNNVALMGGSAGGGSSLWLGTDDRVDVQGILHLRSQATYNFFLWDEILGMDLSSLDYMEFDADVQEMYGGDMSLAYELDMLQKMDASDPPLYIENLHQLTREPQRQGDITHHPNHATYLYQHCLDVGMDCELAREESRAVEFLLRVFQKT